MMLLYIFHYWCETVKKFFFFKYLKSFIISLSWGSEQETMDSLCVSPSVWLKLPSISSAMTLLHSSSTSLMPPSLEKMFHCWLQFWRKQNFTPPLHFHEEFESYHFFPSCLRPQLWLIDYSTWRTGELNQAANRVLGFYPQGDNLF